MLTRPFTRLIVAFGVRQITQRRVAEEIVTGILLLIPFGLFVGLITSRICTKIHLSMIRSDVWTTIVVFLIGDILMEWLLPSLGCLPIIPENSTKSVVKAASTAAVDAVAKTAGHDHALNDDNDFVSTFLNNIAGGGGENSDSYDSFRDDEYHYTITWLLQSYGLYCPSNFANSDSLLTPDATAILFSIRLIFLCIGVYIGESIGSFVALTGGIATGKSTTAKMFVDCSNDNDNDNDDDSNNIGVGSGSGSGIGIRNRRNSKNSNNNNNRTGRGGNRTCNVGNGGGGGGLWDWGWGWGRSALSAAFSDDGCNEGTVQLICADSIAHNILLPPGILADRYKYDAAAADNNDSNNSSSNGNNNKSSGSSRSRGGSGSGGDTAKDNDKHQDDKGDSNYSIFNSKDDDDINNNDHQTTSSVSPKDSVYYQILKAFEGKDILQQENNNSHSNNTSDHEIDRLKLGAIIFNDRNERRKLNSITHPKILSVLIRKLMRNVFFGETDITIGDLPLLFESGKLSWLFGITICVTTGNKDPSIQLHRLQKRNPELSLKECQERIDSQMDLHRKTLMADIIITNDGDLESLREQVEDARRDIMGRLYGIGMSLLQMLLLIGGSTSIAVSSKFYTH